MRPSELLFGDVHVVVTTRDDGDQRPKERATMARSGREDMYKEMDGWTSVHQVHGARVVVVKQRVGALDLDADAIVTVQPSVPIGVLGADCSLIGLIGREGVIGVVHSGWRGLLAGVIEQTIDQMRALGSGSIEAIIGPTIGPECYAFSPGDLVPIVERFGASVHGRTADGGDALDLVEGVTRSLIRAGVERHTRLGGCTSCDARFYSWRAHQDEERHALVMWRDRAALNEKCS